MHQNLNFDHIIVDPTNPGRVAGIIDWRYAEIMPLYRQTIEPYIIGSKDISTNHIYDRSPLKKAQQVLNRRLKSLMDTGPSRNALIKTNIMIQQRRWLREKTLLFWEAMRFQEDDRFDLLRWGSNLFVDGEPWLVNNIAVKMKQHKSGRIVADFDFSGPPFLMSQSMRKHSRDEMRGASKAYGLMHHIKKAVGPEYFDNHGLVPLAQYDEVKEAMRLEKEKFLNGFGLSVRKAELPKDEMREAWPFDD